MIHIDSQHIPVSDSLYENHGADPLVETFEETIGWLTVVWSPYDDVYFAQVVNVSFSFELMQDGGLERPKPRPEGKQQTPNYAQTAYPLPHLIFC